MTGSLAHSGTYLADGRVWLRLRRALWLVPLCPTSCRSAWNLGDPVVMHWLSEVVVLVQKAFLGCGGLKLPGCAMQFLGGWLDLAPRWVEERWWPRSKTFCSTPGSPMQ